MSTFRNFARNTVLSGLSESTTILLFVLMIVAARYLGDEEFGTFSFALAFVGLFEIINDCGLKTLIVREISRNRSEAKVYLGNVLALSMSLSFFGLLLVVLTINIIPASDESKMAVYILEGATIIRAYKFMLRYSFNAMDRFELAALSLFIERITLVLAGAGVLILGYGVVAFSMVFLITRVIDFIITVLIFNHHFWLPRLKFNVSLWPKLLSQSIPFALAGIFLLFLARIDTVMISIMRNNEEVGWYNAATKLIEAVGILPVIIGTSLFPALAVLYQESKESFVSIFNKGVKYIFLLSIPIAILGSILADKLIVLIFGLEYIHSVAVFRILLWSVIFSFMIQTAGAAVGAINKQGKAVLFSGIALVLNIVLNSILIPRFGYIGAGVASLVSLITLAIFIGSYLAIKGYKTSYLTLSIKPLIASLLVALLLTQFDSASVIPLIALSVITYFACITLLGVWDEEEMLTFKKYCRVLVSRLN